MPVTTGWYTSYKSSDALLQGVILTDFPLLDLEELDYPKAESENELTFANTDVMVLTQSCDMQNEKVKLIHIAPVYTLKDTITASLRPDEQGKKKPIESLYTKLRNGFQLNAFLLEDVNVKTVKRLHGKKLVVRYDEAAVVPMTYIEEYLATSKRKYYLALKSPYREALSQGYGRFFMRVASPIDHTDIDFRDYSSS